MHTSLYLHIPFCLKKCLYCDFNSVAETADLDGYVAQILQEMALRRGSVPEPLEAATLYLGGGTPSLLAPKQVARLVEAAAREYGLAADAEITLEANPGTVTLERLKGYREAGVNRLSLGVQALEERLLARLGRVHTVRQAVEALDWARLAGFDNLSLDLMHSLPEQSLAKWEETLRQAIDLKPEHLSAYALSVEGGTPFALLNERGELPLPEEEEAARMFESTVCLLEGSGYRQYEISNFARPGFESRHNGVYWSRGSYLGFGAGAHSFWNRDGVGERFENEPTPEGYAARLARGELPERERHLLSPGEAVSESFFLGLRVLAGIDLAELTARYGLPALEPFLDEVEKLCQTGQLFRLGDRVRLAPEAVIVANSVFRRFL